MKSYFEMSPSERQNFRDKLMYKIETYYIMREEEDENIEFEELLQEIKADMILLENYEGAQALEDIKQIEGWV
jgi:basic membrane lipoprotein Med (substrate-binding protein (PBP1-ABC) superfamily)